jgi:hypothetical protein
MHRAAQKLWLWCAVNLCGLCDSNPVGIPTLTDRWLSRRTLWFRVFRGKIAMRQKRSFKRSDRTARNLLWLMVLVIVISIILVLRTCHGKRDALAFWTAALPRRFKFFAAPRRLQTPNL